MAFLTAALMLTDRLVPASLGTDALPFADVGLQWLLPAAAGGLAGGLFRAHKDLVSPGQSRA
jgi:branched-subunit amino acid permease